MPWWRGRIIICKVIGLSLSRVERVVGIYWRCQGQRGSVMVQLQLCLTVSSHQSLGQGHVVPINSVERVVLFGAADGIF